MQRGGRSSLLRPLLPGGTLAVFTPMNDVGAAPRRPPPPGAPPAPPRAGNGPRGSLAVPSRYQLGAPFLKPGLSVGTGVSAKLSVAVKVPSAKIAAVAIRLLFILLS